MRPPRPVFPNNSGPAAGGCVPPNSCEKLAAACASTLCFCVLGCQQPAAVCQRQIHAHSHIIPDRGGAAEIARERGRGSRVTRAPSPALHWGLPISAGETRSSPALARNSLPRPWQSRAWSLDSADSAIGRPPSLRPWRPGLFCRRRGGTAQTRSSSFSSLARPMRAVLLTSSDLCSVTRATTSRQARLLLLHRRPRNCRLETRCVYWQYDDGCPRVDLRRRM